MTAEVEPELGLLGGCCASSYACLVQSLPQGLWLAVPSEGRGHASFTSLFNSGPGSCTQ